MNKSEQSNPRPRPSTADYDAYHNFMNQLEANPDAVSGVGRNEEERRMIADRLLDSSMDSANPMHAIAYALRAVRLNPACLDARVLLAQSAGGPRDEFVEELQAIVAAGEADLGPEFFAENRGHFWGIFETRPYMRARDRLARELYLAGRVKEAIPHYEEMLQLNPQDNQGLRYHLLGHYLEVHDLQGVQRLLAEYEDESSAMFAWGRVLERYLATKFPEALEAVQLAREVNAHVEDFITGRKKLPKGRPAFYSPGDVSEAIACMDVIGNAWKKYPEAAQWLKKQHGTGNLSTKQQR